MNDASLAFAMSLAPIGARCMEPGFESWWREDEGWENRESGVFLDSTELAARVEESRRAQR